MALCKDALAIELIRNQYRHCKAILVLGTSKALMARAEIPDALADGAFDPGIVFSASGKHEDAVKTFFKAIEKHRHFERETDPPLV